MSGIRRWSFAAAGTAALAVILVGAVIAGAPRSPTAAPTLPVAAPPTTSPTAAASPAQTAVPRKASPVPTRVWFARDQLPPIAAEVLGGDPQSAPGGATAERRIDGRISALWGARGASVPAGAVNEFARVGRDGSSGTLGLSVQVNGDLATVEFDLGGRGWGVSASAETSALIQQLVYTITEEPGIRRALIKEKGKERLEIGNAVIDKPLAREDVFGYERKAALGLREFVGEIRPVDLAVSHTIDEVAALGRVVFTVGGLGMGSYPQFQVQTRPATDPSSRAKYELDVTFPGGYVPTPVNRTEVDRSPIRYIAPKIPSLANAPVNGFVIGVDDLRPWRAVVLFEPTRVVIDVGGPPYGVSEDEATVVYSPARAGMVDRTFPVRGVVRAFEATFSWRIRDARGAMIASGFGKANIGTSPVWGGYELEVSLPATASGNITLELFQGSPRDGTEISAVRIPLFVR